MKYLDRALENLDCIWKIANLSCTPKIHIILAHALEQMKDCEGNGDMLEDDIKPIHQILHMWYNILTCLFF
jgi:hypothetical protein